MTSFLKLKAFSKTFLCPAVTTIPAGELVIPGLVTGVFRDIQVTNLEIKVIVKIVHCIELRLSVTSILVLQDGSLF